MSIEQIHATNDCFKVFPLKNFKTNYNNLKRRIEATAARVELITMQFESTQKCFLGNPKQIEDIRTGIRIKLKSTWKRMYVTVLRV